MPSILIGFHLILTTMIQILKLSPFYKCRNELTVVNQFVLKSHSCTKI